MGWGPVTGIVCPRPCDKKARTNHNIPRQSDDVKDPRAFPVKMLPRAELLSSSGKKG